jgi:glycosyltransferase involved in cell wall biosynthesis
MNQPITSHVKSPILSVYIPTYNRSLLLYRQLSALWGLISAHPDLANEVEIVISDNCSTDNTQDTCEYFLQLFDNLCSMRILRNATNIGAVKNFFQSPLYCHGEYFWILGDDDIILPSSFKDLMSTLSSLSYDLIFCSSMQDHLVAFGEVTVRQLFFEYPITSLAHISRILYRKSLWENFQDTMDDVPSYYVWPLVMPLLPILKTGKAYKIMTPLIYTTKDGGLEVWKGKSALARLAEFYSYCLTIANSRHELVNLLHINFPSAQFIAKKYLAASITFPQESYVFSQLGSLLADYHLHLHPFILLGKFLRTPFGSPFRRFILHLYI